jgi:hypothetical protein
MRHTYAHVDPELHALMARGRLIEPLPVPVRARALDRARAISDAAAESRQIVVSRRRRLPIALAAAFALAAITASAIAAFRGLGAFGSAPVQSRRALVAQAGVPAIEPPPVVVQDPPSIAPTVAPLAPPARVRHAGRPATVREAYAAELELLSRAQTAYAAGAFADALSLVMDHARHFPNGKLAEEREALRVKLLDGVGRVEEARHAAAAFADRFPRSVMLPRLGQGQQSTQ